MRQAKTIIAIMAAALVLLSSCSVRVEREHDRMERYAKGLHGVVDVRKGERA